MEKNSIVDILSNVRKPSYSHYEDVGVGDYYHNRLDDSFYMYTEDGWILMATHVAKEEDVEFEEDVLLYYIKDKELRGGRLVRRIKSSGKHFVVFESGEELNVDDILDSKYPNIFNPNAMELAKFRKNHL